MSKKNIFFRVDSGSHIGSGHVFRCLSLAEEFKYQGYVVYFICRAHQRNINRVVKDRGFTLIELNADSSLIQIENSLMWLGESDVNEVKELNREVRKIGEPLLLVIDHYSIGANIEQNIEVSNILSIDDLAREHCSRFILDQNLTSSKESYTDKNSVIKASYFIGPRYALLNSSFKNINIDTLKKNESIKILSYFGGTDLTGESLKVVKAFIDKKNNQLELKVVLPENHQDYLEILKISNESKNIKVISYVENMALEIAKSDICFGACGVSVWERACLGKPSVVISSASNQVEGALILKKRELAMYLGSGFLTSQDDWEDVIQKVSTDFSSFSKMALKSGGICDGNGASRVANLILKELLSEK